MCLCVSEPKVPVGSAGWHLSGAGPGLGCAAFSALALPRCCCVLAGRWRGLGAGGAWGRRGEPQWSARHLSLAPEPPSAVLRTPSASLGGVVKYDVPAKRMISGKKHYKYKFLACI